MNRAMRQIGKNDAGYTRYAGAYLNKRFEVFRYGPNHWSTTLAPEERFIRKRDAVAKSVEIIEDQHTGRKPTKKGWASEGAE